MKNTKLITFLNSALGKNATIKNSGYTTCQILIKKLEYEINYEILALKDGKSENYIMLDLKKINEIYIEENEAILNLFFSDEVDTDVTIAIS